MVWLRVGTCEAQRSDYHASVKDSTGWMWKNSSGLICMNAAWNFTGVGLLPVRFS